MSNPIMEDISGHPPEEIPTFPPDEAVLPQDPWDLGVAPSSEGVGA